MNKPVASYAGTPPETAGQFPQDAPIAPEGRPRAGFFTATQHFGSSLNLHVHFHVLATDGLYERQPDGGLAFLRSHVPTPDELTALVQRVAARVRLLVGKPAEEGGPTSLLPALKISGALPRVSPASLAVEQEGFNLHANVTVEAHERHALERLCRYMLRGPLADGRLREGPRGNLRYDLKTPRADGTSQIVLSPLALVQRLSWLCVLPKAHTAHYRGVLAPAHPWRTWVVPSRDDQPVPLRRCSARWIDWAELLRRVFAFQVLVCSSCGGSRRVLQVVKEGPVARKILAHLGLPLDAPRRAPARLPTQLDAWDTGPPSAADTEASQCDDQPPPFCFDQRVPVVDSFVRSTLHRLHPLAGPASMAGMGDLHAQSVRPAFRFAPLESHLPFPATRPGLNYLGARSR